MTNIKHEKTFESAIIQSLVEHSGYIQTDAADFSRDLALDKSQVILFLKDMQFKLRGTLDVLRNGIIDYGIRFQMAYFISRNQG